MAPLYPSPVGREIEVIIRVSAGSLGENPAETRGCTWRKHRSVLSCVDVKKDALFLPH